MPRMPAKKGQKRAVAYVVAAMEPDLAAGRAIAQVCLGMAGQGSARSLVPYP